MSKRPFEQQYFRINVAARGSNLSKKQVEEVYAEIKKIDSRIIFHPIFVQTTGDLDQSTSLRQLDKTDFFTREIDHMLLRKECRLAIHSAKDLPEPLPKGLILAALTKGLNPSDALVFQDLKALPRGIVATSSLRREEAVCQLFPDVRFVDVRGTIEARLSLLDCKKVDGVVIAEAALIRLGFTHLKRFRLPGETAPLQGRLALIIHEEDREMFALCRSWEKKFSI